MNKDLKRNIGLTKMLLVDGMKCPSCKKKIELYSFKDNLSIKEFEISGLCQKCQDIAFDSDENIITCDECGKEFSKDEGVQQGNFVVCSKRCAFNLVGLGEYYKGE